VPDLSSADVDRLQRERDLYLRLLDLGEEHDVGPLLSDTLHLVVAVTEAHQGYLELRDEGTRGEGARWSTAYGFADAEVTEVRRAISEGLLAEALATGRTIMAPGATLDPRLEGSVQLGKSQAVLCVPVGDGLGVLYLQGRVAAEPFSTRDLATAQVFARHLAPLADRLLARTRHVPDPTQEFRQRMRLEGVVGRSRAFALMLRQVVLVAPLDVNVLLTGESGTGKSQIARVIHDNSPRAGEPFVELNCAALPESLLESELFGALPGSHSTAVRRIDGKVAVAEHGTLFLDEIGDLSISAQGKLLHLLQTKRFYPLGSSKSLAADVRVLAATNVDLGAAVAKHRFREDLLYRLQVLPVRVPALCERRDDIAELASFFAASACARHCLPRLEISHDASYVAQVAEWPGNVRQLEHAVEAAVIRAAGEGAPRIERRHVFPDTAAAPAGGAGCLTFQDATRQFQAAFLRDALEASGWNVSDVARRLGLARSHIYNLIRAFGIKRNGA
jgi:transcriptional regulator with GAF, ATPase, and Fis domain